jgi:hypothetical protein
MKTVNLIRKILTVVHPTLVWKCSELDLCESEKQKHFLNQTCNCERLYNKVPSSKIVDNEVLIDYRLSCLEMDKSELDLIIKVQLFAHRNNSTGVDA